MTLLLVSVDVKHPVLVTSSKGTNIMIYKINDSGKQMGRMGSVKTGRIPRQVGDPLKMIEGTP